MSLRALIWVFGCGTFSYTLWGTTDPLLQLPWCLLRSEITTLQGSVLYLFNCKCPRLSWVPWVSLLQFLASLLGSLPPCIPQTLYWSSKDHNLSVWIGACRINCDFGEPTNPSSIPVKVTFSGIPGWAQKEVAGSQRSGLAVWSCGSLQPSLKLQIWWFEKAGEYLFPGRKCPQCLQRNPLVAHKWISDSLWIRHGYCKPISILIFLHGPLDLNCMNLSGVSIHDHCFHVNGHQIKWPRWFEAWN